MGVHRARLARHRDSDDSRTVQVMGDHKAACPKPLASTYDCTSPTLQCLWGRKVSAQIPSALSVNLMGLEWCR